jgi:hypothetical protein
VGISNKQAANREIARKAEIEEKLDYIARRLNQLKVIAQLPSTISPTDDVVNRAMDVRTASLKYIAVHIRHESQYFGIAGTYIFAEWHCLIGQEESQRPFSWGMMLVILLALRFMRQLQSLMHPFPYSPMVSVSGLSRKCKVGRI